MKTITKLLQKGLFVFLLVAGIGLPKTEVKAAMADWEMYDDDTASYYESTYAETHTANWSSKSEYTSDPYGVFASKYSKTGKLVVIGADAYAVPKTTLDKIKNKNSIGTELPRSSCKGTKSCAARCSQSIRDDGCKDACATFTIDRATACKGHGWVISKIIDSGTIGGTCKEGFKAEYVLAELHCEKSTFPCGKYVNICFFTIEEYEHQEIVHNNGDGTHTYECSICNTVFKTENHHWGEWEATSAYDRARICRDCDAVDEMHLTPPSESASTGYATYYPDYPSGTIVGASVIKDKLTYHPDEFAGWSYPVKKTPSAGYYWSWDPSTGKQNYKKFKANVNYHPERVAVYTDNSAKNKYTTRAKSALFSGSEEDSSRFWAKYKLTYKAGDSQGSTKAVNVPSPTYTTCHPASISKGYKKTLTYGKNPKFEINTTWQTTTVTASSGAGMYRTGYIFKNWKNGTWGGATWGAGESRTTLPNGAAMKGSQLTANWSNEVYTINYNSNKPGNASHDPSYVAPTKVTFDKKTNELPTPSLTGWTFVGWYTNSNGTGDGTIRLSDYEGRNWTFDPKPTTGENSTIQAYAHWIANTYTVNLLTNRPSISIQDLYRVNGNTFASGGTGWTWNSAGYYSSTFTYDSTSYLPSPNGVYGMTGWTPTANWYWYRNDSTEPYVSAMVGIGYASWNLTPVNGGVVGIYEGWTDNDPNTSGEQDPNYPDPDNGDPINQLKLRADGNNTTRWYASAGKDWYNNANPYVTRLLTLPDGKQYTWGSTWANEDIDLNLWAQDYGTGISTIQMIIDQYPSSAAQAMSTWSTSRGQSASALSMERTDIYNGTTKLHGWSKDYSSKQSTTQQMTVKIDKNAPRKVYVTRTTGTIEAPLSGDGNPYVGNPSYDDYKYGGALIDEAEMCTTFTATVDDRDDTLYDNRDVAGVVMVWVDVWDTEDNSNVKSYRMDLDTSKTFIRNAEDSAYAYGNYNVTANLYKDFPSAANLYYKISAADAAGNLRVLYDSSKDTTGSDYPLDKGSSDDKPLSTPNKDNTGDGSTGVIIRNISIHTWITRDDTSEEACYVTVTDPSGVKKKVPVSDNFFLGGQNGTVHIDTYGYVDEVEIRYPTEAGSGASVTLSGTTYTSTYGDMLLAAWYDQRRGLTTGRLDAELIFNDHGGTYAGDGTETDLRYTTEESGVTKTETKNLPGISGNGYCQRYYAYNFRMPLYINEVLAKASDWSYNNQVYNAKTFVTVQTARKYGTGNSAVGTAIARSESYAKCGTVGDGNDTKLTDTFHTVLYR